MAKVETKIANMVAEEKEKEGDFISLTDEQKKILLDAWKSADKDNQINLKDLTKLAFPNLDIDARSKQGKAVKEFFAKFGIKPKPTTFEKIGAYILSVAEKDFIQGNYNREIDNKLEVTQLLFPDRSVSPLSKEFRAVYSFIQELNAFAPKKENDVENDNKAKNFVPPKTYTECIRLINKYTHDIICIQEASEKDKQGVNALVKYLHSPRFTHMVNTYRDKGNSELFLSEFIRATFDKPDLTVDELNLYLNLCSDYVSSSQIKKEIEFLSIRLQEIIEDPDGKMSTSLADTISAKNREYNDCLERQEKLVSKLNGNRSARLQNQATANSSIKSLVEYWRSESGRKKLLYLTKIREKARLENVLALDSMESIKAEMFGAVDEGLTQL